MNTSIAISHNAVSPFDLRELDFKELNDIALYWQKIAAPFRLSVSTFVDIRNSFVELIALQNGACEKLNELTLVLDSMSFSDDLTLNSEAYAALRHLRESLEANYEILWKDQKNHHNHSEGTSKWWSVIYFISSRKAYATRKKLMKAIKHQKSKVIDLLRRKDAVFSVSSSKFVTLDADTLWQNRCKAYEYIL